VQGLGISMRLSCRFQMDKKGGRKTGKNEEGE
jgi:hypothetical protein